MALAVATTANKRKKMEETTSQDPVSDSYTGVTCHQCRHKTLGIYANCKNQENTKPCTIKYCRTCLLNRYGENVEDVLVLEKWDCPKYRGVCNCSNCMKKRGHQPTGMVIQMAKACGFSSVSDMIAAKGVQNVSNYKRVKETTASPRKLTVPAKVFDGKKDSKATQRVEDNHCLIVKKDALDLLEAVVPLPTGIELVTIAGVDLPKEDVGNALQFLEFSLTFGKILDVEKGQAEAVLRDLYKGRSTRRGKFTPVIQFHIHLLSVIQDKSESESESESETSDPIHGNSWLKDLKSCISESKLKHMNLKDMTAGAYDKLDSSMKLRLLVFLCDEVLETEKVRNWIDDQNAKFSEKRKEAKDNLFAAKDKEKSLKQKMQDDIAKAITAKEGDPLTIKEHDAIVSKIKDEAAEAQAEILACKKLVPLDTEMPDAVRTEPIFSDKHGHVYWRLKGCSEKPIILQDIGTGDHIVKAVEKWYEYDDEQMELIEKHINVLRPRY